MAQSRIRQILQSPLPPVRRWSAHAIFAAVVWPGLTIVCAAYSLKRMPYYTVSWRDAFLAGGAGTLLRVPELIVVGASFFGLSAFIFSRLGAEWRPGRLAGVRLGLEPVVTFVAAAAGISLWYPAVLSEPLFLLFDFLPVAGLLLLLAALVAVGVVATGRRGKRLRLAVAMACVGLLCPVPLWVRASLEPHFGTPPTAVLLGVDSLSHHDDLGSFAEWVKGQGGTWYERAVTPGLFTNAVWTSILTLQPIRTHGVFHTFQRMRAEDSALLNAARGQGYRTVSMFSDQLTAAPGSTAGFDEDRSGPMGWRQLLQPMVANASLILPVIGAALPRPWPGGAPSNEAGTFTYDVRREVRRILRAGEDGQRTFVAAHLTYIHLPAYPSVLELSRSEFLAVLKAPVRVVRDRTIDWQDLDLPDDPLPLSHWKVRRVQSILEQEVAASGYVQQGGHLVVFSDHGSRNSLDTANFGDDRYQHVVLATFGLPARCSAEPISLIDIGKLFGFSDVQAEPTVEFAVPPPDTWPTLFRTAHFRWSGEVDVDQGLLAEVFAGLKRFNPWPPSAACK